MSSNYPPGVTGNEYQIAGPDAEIDEQQTCGAQGVKIFVASKDVDRNLIKLIQEMEADMQRGVMPTDPGRWLFLARQALGGIGAYEVDCPFVDGDVVSQVYQGVKSWTCPVCGTDHEEDLRDD